MAFTTHPSTSSTTVNTTYSSTSFNTGAMLPPTCNHLDAAQRARLIKSSRKLGKVLGTTPFVLESLPPLPTSSSSTSMSETALKRCSAPPTPTPTYPDFSAAAAAAGSKSGGTRSRKVSHASTSSEGESVSSATHPFLAECSSASISQHRKANSDGLASLHGLDVGRHKSKRHLLHQPVLRLPPASLGNAGLPSPLRESFPYEFPPGYNLNLEKHPINAAATPPLPRSPTSPLSPMSSEMPRTPPPASSDPLESMFGTLAEDVGACPDADLTFDAEESDSRLRKRRMEKLMRHLGERVPSELVFGSTTRPRGAPLQESAGAGASTRRITGTTQGRVTRRVSVISGHRKRERERPYAEDPEEHDTPGPGCFSDPEPGNSARVHAVLTRERSEIRVGRGERREKEKERDGERMRHLVEDEWTPEAYEDVVKRLRRLR